MKNMLGDSDKKVLFLFLYFMAFYLICPGQNKQLFKALEIQPIPNVNWTSDNSNIISPFKNVLKKYNILSLAESSHLDGTVSDAQCMLIKELINAGVINTIYTESSLLNIDKINKILKKEGTAGIAKAEYYFGSGELGYWSRNGFWHFLANKIIDGKVNLVGIDIETTSDTLMKEMLIDVFKLNSIQALLIKFPEEITKIKNEFLDVRNWYLDVNYSTNDYVSQSEFIEVAIKEYYEKNDSFRIKQWKTIQKYLYWRSQRCLAIRNVSYSEMLNDNLKLTKFFSIRDSFMAETLLEHYQKNTNVKAVLITTAYHTQRINFDKELSNSISDSSYFLGDILHKRIKDQVYNLCFVASSGKVGTIYYRLSEITRVKKPQKGSFEDYFKRSRYDNFFTDLSTSRLKNQPFGMKVLFKSYYTAKWSQIFDGIFFIKKMYPLNYEQKEGFD